MPGARLSVDSCRECQGFAYIVAMQWEPLFDEIAEGVVALDANAAFIYANPAAATLFGRKAADMPGTRLQEFARNDATAGLASVTQHALESGFQAEVEVYHPARERWYALRGYPRTGGFVVFLQDITDKKLAEDSLRLSQAKFAGIVNISADAIISINAAQLIIHYNSGAEEIFGWRAAEMIGQKLDVLLPERFRPGHAQHIRNFAASSVDARRMGERREIAGLRRNGEEFPAEASISKISVGDERVFTVVLRDITERKRREENYRRLYEEAQRAVAARDDVLSFVSHDLGNPLAAIRVATAVLLRRGTLEESDAGHVAGIRDAVEQAQRLIRDLLDVQKAEAGKLALHFEALDVRALVAETVGLLRMQIDEKGLRIDQEFPVALPRAKGDHDRVLQVLGNLLGNAIKFSPAQSTIGIAAREGEGEIVVYIRDEGPGLRPDEIPHIFDRYWQARKTGKVGHGIGLAIVQAIARSHGGRVWAESEFGSGSTFILALPMWIDGR
jgi:PAS domain S-box-containing protein